MMLRQRTRSQTWLCALLALGVLTAWAAGCSLSPNPDLPGFPAGDGDGDTTGLDSGDGDGDGAGGALHVGGMGGGGAGGVGGEVEGEEVEGEP